MQGQTRSDGQVDYLGPRESGQKVRPPGLQAQRAKWTPPKWRASVFTSCEDSPTGRQSGGRTQAGECDGPRGRAHWRPSRPPGNVNVQYVRKNAGEPHPDGELRWATVLISALATVPALAADGNTDRKWSKNTTIGCSSVAPACQSSAWSTTHPSKGRGIRRFLRSGDRTWRFPAWSPSGRLEQFHTDLRWPGGREDIAWPLRRHL
ncbi:Uncharacterised protein [Bordetella ansorpii]|uniref:Uncharacterized protein n=1 Tax=Bordetella ansorpii TaxID=288768 RepID=A0A157S8L0_9BORD|nr:Uncharacterised protein [Bordetella ansorpii]